MGGVAAGMLCSLEEVSGTVTEIKGGGIVGRYLEESVCLEI